jgi:hypothetical protein
MKYESFKESSFIKIKNTNLSNFIKYEYSIDQSNIGKKIQGAYIRKYFKLFIKLLSKNNIPNRNELFVLKNRKFIPNIHYKNLYYNSEKYSKDWWKV